MKINGRKIGPSIETVVIPREGEDFVFRAQAVLDYSEFDTNNPEPKPPEALMPGGERKLIYDNPKYQERVGEWAESKTHWMILKSLQATEGLEWETVKMEDPSTWPNYQEEMKTSGLSPAEINTIVQTVITANGLNQQKIDEALERFLAGQARLPENASSPSTEQQTTPSGEPANG
jgi:hypothetical protein